MEIKEWSAGPIVLTEMRFRFHSCIQITLRSTAIHRVAIYHSHTCCQHEPTICQFLPTQSCEIQIIILTELLYEQLLWQLSPLCLQFGCLMYEIKQVHSLILKSLHQHSHLHKQLFIAFLIHKWNDMLHLWGPSATIKARLACLSWLRPEILI